MNCDDDDDDEDVFCLGEVINLMEVVMRFFCGLFEKKNMNAWIIETVLNFLNFLYLKM